MNVVQKGWKFDVGKLVCRLFGSLQSLQKRALEVVKCGWKNMDFEFVRPIRIERAFVLLWLFYFIIALDANVLPILTIYEPLIDQVFTETRSVSLIFEVINSDILTPAIINICSGSWKLKITLEL